MNILHMKYAVCVAEAGSISKASEIALVAQPNLSRSIKELEADLGITIFSRTAKGMYLTPDGEEFIGYAKKLLRQFDELEAHYKTGTPQKQFFSISVPRASYISDAFARFTETLTEETCEIYYNETNTTQAINNIIKSDYRLGIIRYAENFDNYYKTMLEEKGLASELITEFQYVLLLNKNSPLARQESIDRSHLNDYIEITHADNVSPALPSTDVKKEELSGDIDRKIFVFERGSQFDILSGNPNAFMWVSPVPAELLERYGLVLRTCSEVKRVYRDVLVYRSNYHLTTLDCQFITELCRSKRNCIG